MGSNEHPRENFWQKVGKFWQKVGNVTRRLVNLVVLAGALAAAFLEIRALLEWWLSGHPFP
jgi:hypothetical protein